MQVVSTDHHQSHVLSALAGVQLRILDQDEHLVWVSDNTVLHTIAQAVCLL